MLCGKAHRAYDQLHHAVFNGRSAGCCLRLVTDIEGGNNHQLSNGIRPLDFLDFFGPLYRLSQPKNNKQVNSWIHFQRIFCWFYLVVHSPKASTVEAIRIIWGNLGKQRNGGGPEASSSSSICVGHLDVIDWKVNILWDYTPEDENRTSK